MHPMLCSFPAAAFYGGQVQTSVDITSQLLAFEFRGNEKDLRILHSDA